ncbi:MAG: kinase, partial [Gammaproteobacteria bacterium]|nr:kinase [Gammaproteobacteria bacterium]
AIYRWRLEQERQLAAVTSATAPGVMSARQVADFIQIYERITRNNLALLPASADVVLELDENHGCLASRYD